MPSSFKLQKAVPKIMGLMNLIRVKITMQNASMSIFDIKILVAIFLSRWQYLGFLSLYLLNNIQHCLSILNVAIILGMEMKRAG